MKKILKRIVVSLILAALVWIFITPMYGYDRLFCLTFLVIIVTLICLVEVVKRGSMLFVIALGALEWYLLWMSFMDPIMNMP